MKRLITIFTLLTWLSGAAQDGPTYSDLLKSAEEVVLSDSLHINGEPFQKHLLDSMAVKKWFSNVLPSTAGNRLKNRNYYLTGKITSNQNFDLLLLMEQKNRNDSTGVQVVYLVTSKKDGTYIASIEAAVAGIKKKTSYNTSSWLFKDNKIVLATRMTINQRSYDDLANYKINNGGRFILYPKY
ncbi:MAG: hypothetical protein ABI688_09915 [Bacteroidota bacterium]